MTRAEVEGAKASCQLFGSVALFTLTMAPKSHDDIPVSVLSHIRNDLSEEGVKAVVVDAHNSLLEEDLLTDADAENLHKASMEAFRKARREEQRSFSVAAATVVPEEWGLDEGVGPCGISALLVRLETGEIYAYVVFDSNNMTTGLREVLLDVIREEGCVDGEALTSDTHLVNGIGVTDRGYYSASSKLAPAQASFSSVSVPNLPVIGENGLNTFRHILDSGFSLFKRASLIILPVTIALAAVVIYML
jgi:predicted neutral ceramidase superfamily lipid hydrolase